MMSPICHRLVVLALGLLSSCTIWNGVELPANADGGTSQPVPSGEGSKGYADAVSSSGPIAYFRFAPFAQGAARVVLDASGHHHDCTVSTGVTIESGPFQGASAARFHGSDVVDCTGDSAFDMHGQSPFTFEGFVLQDEDRGAANTAEYRFLFDRMAGANESTRTGYYAFLGRHPNDSAWSLVFEHWRGKGNESSVPMSSARELVAGTWAHFAFTIDAAGTMTGYLNGAPQNTAKTVAGATPVGVRLVLGADQTGASGLVGKLAEFAIYDKALDANAIAAHYGASGLARP